MTNLSAFMTNLSAANSSIRKSCEHVSGNVPIQDMVLNNGLSLIYQYMKERPLNHEG